ncbi:heterokaryon incompatibility protein-domain-containing protein [Microdochium trichocladiopsis]|uniref:Heterokaryon incompatibility protein-domain-containing protein n=1 Tax=Microdochium trichocladiopsis TaxID=1682393 RepID=A0A9P8XUF3_9PEZI|nr:heterokaryon incompatibility protein-domain-containing protein [Microdochium trichocladiopsis]KAH7012650.1 heterokaryon incompatibility protein-domain-containing protein [Microdochium trichocladiopsis]
MMLQNNLSVGLPMCGTAGHVYDDPNTDKFWEFVERQIKVCTEEHDNCRACDRQAETAGLLPTRLIQLDTPTERELSIRLVDTHEEPDMHGKTYVALSHRWGEKMPITTTRETFSVRKFDIPWNSLSLTFQDAIRVALRIGIHLIWIDSLCIIQGDKDDWEIEAAKMASIYRSAFAVISATSANGPHDGFLDREASYAPVRGTTVTEEPFELYLRRSRLHHGYFTGSNDALEPGDHALLSRAWCFQERLLGTRVIHFVKDDIIFECLHGAVCQCGGLPRHRSIESSNARRYVDSLRCSTCGAESVSVTDNSWQREHAEGCSAIVFSAWEDIVADYSKTSITFPADWLPALSGIANQLSEQVKSRYFAGLWGNNILDGLLWVPCENRESSRQPRNQSKAYIAPSWSWAGVQKEVSYAYLRQKARGSPRYYPEFDINNSDCVLDSHHNPFGTVSAGWLRLKGPALPATLAALADRKPPLIRGKLQTDGIPNADRADLMDFIADDPVTLQGRVGHRVWLLPVVQRSTRDTWSLALVLAEPFSMTSKGRSGVDDLPDTVRNHHTVLQRVGLMESYCHDDLQHDRYSEEIDFYLI